MVIRNHGWCVTFFGDATEPWGMQADRLSPEAEAVAYEQALARVSGTLGVDTRAVVLLEQVHGVDGVVATQEFLEHYQVRCQKGDWIITREPRIALGVATADCVPLIAIDRASGLVGALHAGWRGLVGGAIETFLHTFVAQGGSLETMTVEIGPSARSCCYAVGRELIDALHNREQEPAVEFRTGQWFLDCPRYAASRVHAFGIAQEHIDLQSAFCTICTEQFASHRRTKTRMRNVSGVVIKT